MEGRYGLDNLGKFLIIVGLILLIGGPLISPADMLGWVFALSRNFASRERENEVYLKVRRAPKRFFQKISKRWKNRKTTKYFKCKDCKQPLSVPKGKGKLRIICPKCGKEIFIKS